MLGSSLFFTCCLQNDGQVIMCFGIIRAQPNSFFVTLRLFLGIPALAVGRSYSFEKPVLSTHFLRRSFCKRGVIDCEQSVELALRQKVTSQTVRTCLVEGVERQINQFKDRLRDEE